MNQNLPPPAHDDAVIKKIIQADKDNAPKSELILVLHHLWSKAVNTPNYDRSEWDWIHNQLTDLKSN